MNQLKFGDGGATLIAATDKGIVSWDSKSGERQMTFECEPVASVHKLLCFSTLVGKHDTSVSSAASVASSEVAAGVAASGSTLSKTKVLIYNHLTGKAVGEVTMRLPILSVNIQRDKLIVVVESKVYCYNLHNLTKIVHLDTHINPLGLCCVVRTPTPTTPVVSATSTVSDGDCVVVTMGVDTGTIQIVKFSSVAAIAAGGEAIQVPIIIPAHTSGISALAVHPCGTLVASASKDGTIIRVFRVATKEKIHEFRRGKNPVNLLSLEFNSSGDHLLCSSDSGTVHLWVVEGASPPLTPAEGAAAPTSGAPASANVSTSDGKTVGADKVGEIESKVNGDADGKVTESSTSATSTSETKSTSLTGSATSSLPTSTSTPSVIPPVAGGAVQAGGAAPQNRTSYLSFASAILPEYFNSKWSFCQYRFPAGSDKRCIACFAPGSDNLLYVAGYNGKLLTVRYLPDGQTDVVNTSDLAI